jgi:hypothetical protein
MTAPDGPPPRCRTGAVDAMVVPVKLRRDGSCPIPAGPRARQTRTERVKFARPASVRPGAGLDETVARHLGVGRWCRRSATVQGRQLRITVILQTLNKLPEASSNTLQANDLGCEFAGYGTLVWGKIKCFVHRLPVPRR